MKAEVIIVEELTQRLDEIRKAQQDLANTTEGHFEQEDMDALYIDGLMSLIQKKAKLSFKAGIKEVVEWIENNISMKTDDNGIFIQGYFAGKKWQTQKKDWGIKE